MEEVFPVALDKLFVFVADSVHRPKDTLGCSESRLIHRHGFVFSEVETAGRCAAPLVEHMAFWHKHLCANHFQAEVVSLLHR